MRQAWPHAVCLDTALNRLAGDEGDIAVLSVDVGGGQGSGAVGGDAGSRGGVLGVVEGARSVLVEAQCHRRRSYCRVLVYTYLIRNN